MKYVKDFNANNNLMVELLQLLCSSLFKNNIF